MFKRKSVIFLLAAIVLLVFAICAFLNFDPYEIVNKDGNYYLKFNYEDYNYKSDIGLVSAPTVYFDSVEEMKYDILNHNFTADEFKEIRRMALNKSFQLFDLNNLIEPVYPSVFDNYSVSWSFNNYGFHLDSAQYEPFNNFHTLPDEYAEELITEFNNFESKETISIQKKTIDENNRTIIDYYVPSSNAQATRIAYTLSTETKTLYIEELLLAQKSYDSHSLNIIGIDNGIYFRVHIDHYDKPLTDDLLLEFGIKEYVEP